MKTLFYGHIYLYYNSVEGTAKYFYTPSYKSLLCAMIKYLVDDEHIDAKEHKISFTNSIDFITDGDGGGCTVNGSSDEQDLAGLLKDLSNDNIETEGGDTGWFSYKAPQGGVVKEDNLIMTVSYNHNYKHIGYENIYHTLIGKSENDLLLSFLHWTNTEFGDTRVHMPKNFDKIVTLLNKHNPPDENLDCGGLDIKYRIENLKGEKIKGANII